MDIDDLSFPPIDEEGIPYVAPLANEVTLITDEPNSWLGAAPLPCEEGLRRRYGLRTLTKVKAGEEMTWDYGPGFGLRPYPSKYNRRGTKRRAR